MKAARRGLSLALLVFLVLGLASSTLVRADASEQAVFRADGPAQGLTPDQVDLLDTSETFTFQVKYLADDP